MRRFFYLLVLSGWMLVPAAWGCRCKEPSSTAKAYRGAQLVVRAMVLSVEGEGDSANGARARLRVAEAWKADTTAEVMVSTRTTCAFQFEVGKPYLIYLTRDSGSSEWSTSICRGNLPISKDDTAVVWLRRNAKKATIQP